MSKFLPLLGLWLLISPLFGQYQFTKQDKLDCYSVQNQARTGTCWSFATFSFLESEIIRQGGPELNISEMYAVRTIYLDKAQNYLLRQGKANFSQGSLSHDVIRAMKMGGAVPESAYSGLVGERASHDHSEMERILKAMLDGLIANKMAQPDWRPAFNALLDQYLGEVPESFVYQGQAYTPESFAEGLGIDPEEYISLTSYTHHPFYLPFILEIPDNYSNGSYYNLPLQDLQEVVDFALDQGFTVAWDGDVSEPGFSAQNGLAVLPSDGKREDLFVNPGAEVDVSQELRQTTFETYQTTDDHLMHIVGRAKDQDGQTYYLVKNSWGKVGPYEGYLYMSVPYFQLKTVAIMVHQDAIPPKISSKCGLGDR